ncbi:F-box/LRR-repeat protein, partial [Trifolium medium]|nr:F-box/LRR-repeat protein [Trifolium medium]
MFPNSLNPSDLFLIAECFPLLEQLDLSNPRGCQNYSSYVDGVEALSLALIKLRKSNEITSAGLTSAIRERPTLREGLPLTRLDLHSCNGYSYAGIFRLLSKCQCIQHLNLEGADYLNDQHVVQLSSFLGDLVSINLSDCREITYSALFALVRKCPSLSEIKMESIG